MLAATGLGIAFHARPMFAASAEPKIGRLGLGCVPYLMGFLRDRNPLEEVARRAIGAINCR